MAKSKSTGKVSAEAAVIKPKVVKPLTDKEKEKADFIDSIRKRLSKIEIPKELELSPYEKIIDTRKFFDGHLSRISLSGRNVDTPYNDRLKRVLKIVGIEIENFDVMLNNQK